mmetsp:Transcript_2210/g.5625  ORF Transcript_2210/g.5625 Transcript_2210/m.5625 type:complete len:124 (-) Transcript_2210:476-847(-)|eukprot:CAMPEP_0202866622 /NCGR_PEP_ID=MMETSP1391-20130828/8185_1 /ASSEMBLY_ACC=CAM_ASM_000867 /TAXON_ID=1034604 /ORGANISM="Chlamydomonas leiostraca, Strain SAG 11-49" /LENGTH=123 /DNA_ID=CAMNT_0049546591 /DNA_START=56 /DNA_END=427 /DNA_ORIENTATION=+
MAQQEAYHAIVKALPHRLRVMRMYRYGLRELLNWSANRHEWYPRAHALRAEFEANKAITDRTEIGKMVELGEDLISRFRHWEPVLRPEVPGGTAYSINPEHPRNVRALVNWDMLDPAKRGDWM